MKKSIIYFIMIITLSLSLNSQVVSIKTGLFSPFCDSDLWEINFENLALSKTDMLNTIYSMEYEHFINRRMSISFEGSNYSKTFYSSYRDYEYDDGTPINQNIYLKIMGFEINLKFYPTMVNKKLNPYFGIGGGLVYWDYEQWGEFINFEEGYVYEGYADTKTFTPVFNLRAGLLYRITYNIGLVFETKYSYAKGNLSSLFEDFEKFDLSGLIFNFGFSIFLD